MYLKTKKKKIHNLIYTLYQVKLKIRNTSINYKFQKVRITLINVYVR